MKLKCLKASSVRGIPTDWPELAVGSRGMVIFGPNGVGKSSIVDALEYGISEKTSLYPVQRHRVNWDTGAPHTRGGAPDISIEVSVGSGSFTLSSGTGIGDISDDSRAWVATARGASFVLRRHMLLRFITSDPSGRYALLEPFMNLGAYQDVEDELRDWKDQLDTQSSAANATAAGQAGSLKLVFDLDHSEPIDEAALLAKLNSILRELGLSEIVMRSELEGSQAQVAIELGGAEQNARLAALGGLKTEIQHLGHARDLTEMLTGLVASLDELDREMETRTDAILTDLLVRGKEVIETARLESCPVCEQDIDQEAVVARLKERIEADSRITAARNLVAERHRELLEQLHDLARPLKQFAENWAAQVGAALPDVYAQTSMLLEDLESALGRDEPNANQAREFIVRLASSITNHDEVIAILDELILSEGGGDRRISLNLAASMIKAMLEDWPRYEEATINADTIDGTKTTVTRIYGHAVEARKSALRITLDEVANTANEFYEQIHLNEHLAYSSLEVRDTGQGSVILSTKFDGRRENPLLHYSESHLDTLGLCYFLALRRHEAQREPGFKVLILDDVMHSVDADHRSRIAGLIKDEFADHQVIITTHDVHFYDALYRELGTGGYTYGRINNWDLVRGPVFGDPLTDFARIMVPQERERLSQETLSAAGGRFFEWLLRETTEAIHVPIPVRFKRGYEIGQLWPPLASRLRKQGGYAAVNLGLIDRLEQNGWVRNACGAHYNPDPVPPTPSEVREFAEMLSELYETLYCKECRNFVSQQPDRVWRCPNGHVSYAKSSNEST